MFPAYGVSADVSSSESDINLDVFRFHVNITVLCKMYLAVAVLWSKSAKFRWV